MKQIINRCTHKSKILVQKYKTGILKHTFVPDASIPHRRNKLVIHAVLFDTVILMNSFLKYETSWFDQS